MNFGDQLADQNICRWWWWGAPATHKTISIFSKEFPVPFVLNWITTSSD